MLILNLCIAGNPPKVLSGHSDLKLMMILLHRESGSLAVRRPPIGHVNTPGLSCQRVVACGAQVVSWVASRVVSSRVVSWPWCSSQTWGLGPL